MMCTTVFGLHNISVGCMQLIGYHQSHIVPPMMIRSMRLCCDDNDTDDLQMDGLRAYCKYKLSVCGICDEFHVMGEGGGKVCQLYSTKQLYISIKLMCLLICCEFPSFHSPSGTIVHNIAQIREYLLSPGTCKCGLPCPLRPEHFFEFNSQVSFSGLCWYFFYLQIHRLIEHVLCACSSIGLSN